LPGTSDFDARKMREPGNVGELRHIGTPDPFGGIKSYCPRLRQATAVHNSAQRELELPELW